MILLAFLLQTYQALSIYFDFQVESKLVNYVPGKPKDIAEICGDGFETILCICIYWKCNYRFPLSVAFSMAHRGICLYVEIFIGSSVVVWD